MIEIKFKGIFYIEQVQAIIAFLSRNNFEEDKISDFLRNRALFFEKKENHFIFSKI
jgi:hypothetical protein